MKITAIFSYILFLSLQSYSQVHVDFKLSPAGKFSADTKEVKGFASLVNNKVTAENVSVPLNSLNSGIGLRDDHMKNKYLETSKFPDAVLVKAEGVNGKGTGRLKMRGVEKDIQGTYTVKGQQVTAEFEVKLSDFNISGIKYMGVGVNDVAKVSVTIPLKAASAAAPAASTPKATAPAAAPKK